MSRRRLLRESLLAALAAGAFAWPAAALSEDGSGDDTHLGPEPLKETPRETAIARREVPRGTDRPQTAREEDAARLLELAAKALRSEGSPAETRAQVALARGRVGEALAMLESAKGEEVPARLTVLRALALIRAGEPGEAAGLLREAAGAIESRGALSLRSLSFASRIMSFGVWDEMEASFRGGQRVMTYCEVIGFACVRRAADDHSVKLRMALAIEREDGTVVVEQLREDTVEHKTKSRIHDLHLCTQFDLPPGLPAGKYVLKATVTDKATGSSAALGIPFEIAPGAGR